MDTKGRLAIVIGLGRSGVAAAELLVAQGARVSGTDTASRATLSPDAIALESRGVELVLGSHAGVPFESADLVVISPGVPTFPALREFEASGREVIGEMEFASRFVKAPIVLVGGTNGKST